MMVTEAACVLTKEEAKTIVRLLGLLQESLLATLETSIIPGSGTALTGKCHAAQVQDVRRDRQNLAIAKELVAKFGEAPLRRHRRATPV